MKKKIVVIVAIIAISKIDIGPRNSITFVNTFNNDFLHQESSSPKVALNQLYIDEEEETNKRLQYCERLKSIIILQILRYDPNKYFPSLQIWNIEM